MARHYELTDSALTQVMERCERAGKRLCGLDEAGRGALAGPVVAAAVFFTAAPPPGLADSKTLTAKRRAALFDAIHAVAYVGVGICGADVIDRINILQANFVAMQSALAAVRAQLPASAGLGAVLVDGDLLSEGLLSDCQESDTAIFALVKGDSKVLEISAASIIAKVTRDRMMAELAPEFPNYGFSNNSGYGSAKHFAALKEFGPCRHHRLTFEPAASLANSLF